jgi:hypothetical protein
MSARFGRGTRADARCRQEVQKAGGASAKCVRALIHNELMTKLAGGHLTMCGRWPPRGSAVALAAIKAIHTLAWFSIESSMVCVLYDGFVGRSDRRTAVAASVVAGESLIFVANGWRCPLTQLVEWVGDEHGSVTDIYLPGWLAGNLVAIHVPLIALAGYLHARNLQRRR